MGYAQPVDMYEIFNRLRNNPNLFAKIIVASFFVNLLALATPIYVIQVLQRYVAYGVTSTLVTLVVGIIFVTIFEFFFRNIRHRMTRETESVNASLSDKVMKKIVWIDVGTHYAQEYESAFGSSYKFLWQVFRRFIASKFFFKGSFYKISDIKFILRSKKK